MVYFKLICKICNKSMKLNEEEYEKHFQKNHARRINNKQEYYNAYVLRILNSEELKKYEKEQKEWDKARDRAWRF